MSVCPHCGEELDDATHLDDKSRKPEAGDLSVCFYCGQVLVFTAPYVVRAITPEEEIALDNETRAELDHIQTGVKKFQKQRQKP